MLQKLLVLLWFYLLTFSFLLDLLFATKPPTSGFALRSSPPFKASKYMSRVILSLYYKPFHTILFSRWMIPIMITVILLTYMLSLPLPSVLFLMTPRSSLPLYKFNFLRLFFPHSIPNFSFSRMFLRSPANALGVSSSFLWFLSFSLFFFWLFFLLLFLFLVSVFCFLFLATSASPVLVI